MIRTVQRHENRAGSSENGGWAGRWVNKAYTGDMMIDMNHIDFQSLSDARG